MFHFLLWLFNYRKIKNLKFTTLLLPEYKKQVKAVCFLLQLLVQPSLNRTTYLLIVCMQCRFVKFRSKWIVNSWEIKINKSIINNYCINYCIGINQSFYLILIIKLREIVVQTIYVLQNRRFGHIQRHAQNITNKIVY